MNGEDSRPTEGETLSYLNWKTMKAVIDKLIEANLPSKAFERLSKDFEYRRAVVQFMRGGYDDQKKAEDQERAKTERYKNRHRFHCSGSAYDDEMMEQFCASAACNPEHFLRTLAFSLVYSIVHINKGNGEYGMMEENVVALRGLLPAANEEVRVATHGGTIAAWGLVTYCRSACEHFFAPDAFFQYASKSNSGLHHRLTEAVREYWCSLAENPALLLQLLATDFCKLLVGGELDTIKVEYLLKLFNKHGYNQGTPEVDSGLIFNHYCRTVLEWVAARGDYPDFSQCYSPNFCCEQMYTLYNRVQDQTALLSGSLGKGLNMYVPDDKQRQKEAERIYFEQCPYCSSKLYAPPGAKIFDPEKDSRRLGIWRR